MDLKWQTSASAPFTRKEVISVSESSYNQRLLNLIPIQLSLPSTLSFHCGGYRDEENTDVTDYHFR